MEGKEVRAVFKTGNSIAVALPPAYLRENKVNARDRMELLFSGPFLIIRPVKSLPIKEAVEEARKAVRGVLPA